MIGKLSAREYYERALSKKGTVCIFSKLIIQAREKFS